MTGPTDLLHPSPAPHFKTFQLFFNLLPKPSQFQHHTKLYSKCSILIVSLSVPNIINLSKPEYDIFRSRRNCAIWRDVKIVCPWNTSVIKPKNLRVKRYNYIVPPLQLWADNLLSKSFCVYVCIHVYFIKDFSLSVKCAQNIVIVTHLGLQSYTDVCTENWQVRCSTGWI
jgi:hypothetical protein